MDGSSQSGRYRAIFISDVHLGTRRCKAECLLDFLKHAESEYLYLVGDIVDGWRLKTSWHWPPQHNDVIQALLRKARTGTKVVYIPGNHDEALRDYARLAFGGIAVASDTIHATADGRRLLVLHGDEFDGIVRDALWLAKFGDRAYGLALSANHGLNRIRRRLGMPYWSLAAYLKSRVEDAVKYVANFQRAVVDEARRRGAQGVVCGHIHKAEIRDIDGVLYCNDGDWVESCTALVEHYGGRLEILHWADLRGFSAFSAYAKAHA